MNTEDRLWLLVIGGMLSSKEFRDEVRRNIAKDDVPEQYRGMFWAVLDSKGQAVREISSTWGVDPKAPTVLAGALHKLKGFAMKRFMEGEVARLQAMKVLQPEQLRGVLEHMLSGVIAREATLAPMETPTGPGTIPD